MTDDALTITALDVRYADGVHAVRGVDLAVPEGRCLGLVGESGSGKSTVVNAVLGLLPRSARVSGSVVVDGTEVIGASGGTLHRLRGKTLGLVAQDPMASFDPLMSVAGSVAEAWRVHHERPGHDEVGRALERLGIDHARVRSKLRPHMWSGGMLQRAAIAAAEAHHPRVIVADEPTSALDADRADAIVTALRDSGSAILLVSHDLALVARHSDEVAVMYAGEVVERGSSAQVLERPRHPYTRALLAATPRPGQGLPVALEGAPPRLDEEPCGCAFAPRCSMAVTHCRAEQPRLVAGVSCWEAS